MSDLMLGTLQGRYYGNIRVGEKLDNDKELSIAFEELPDGTEERYLSLVEIAMLRDHLTSLLGG